MPDASGCAVAAVYYAALRAARAAASVNKPWHHSFSSLAMMKRVTPLTAATLKTKSCAPVSVLAWRHHYASRANGMPIVASLCMIFNAIRALGTIQTAMTLDYSRPAWPHGAGEVLARPYRVLLLGSYRRAIRACSPIMRFT